MQPRKLPYKVFRELNAFRVYLEATMVDPAFSCYHIQIAAWCRGEKNRALFVFKLFETTEPASQAQFFPGILPILLSH